MLAEKIEHRFQPRVSIAATWFTVARILSLTATSNWQNSLGKGIREHSVTELERLLKND